MGPSYWGRNLPFVDFFRASGRWGSQPASLPLDLDSQGWVSRLAPGQVARIGVLIDLDGHFPAGRYTVLYEGKGQLLYSGDGRLDSAASRPGRDVLVIERPGEGGILVAISKSDPKDPIRNVRVLMPGGVCSGDALRGCRGEADCEGAGACRPFEEVYENQIFNPLFLSRLRDFSVLRFGHWMDVGDSEQRQWSDRPRTEDMNWFSEGGGRGGVPVEILVALANRLDAHPWFTLPHEADDEYVSRFARLVAAKLDPDLRVWVEYSNEVWNGIFTQHDYAREQGRARDLADDDSLASARFYSERSLEIFAIFEKEFGGSSRLVRVLASQAVNSWLSREILSWKDAWRHADALAVAPYFGLGPSDEAQAAEFEFLGSEELLDHLEQEVLPETLEGVRAQHQVAKEYGLRLVAYEGGQHLVAYGPAADRPRLSALFDAVQRHPRMKELYLRYLEGWKARGGGVFLHYSDCAGFGRHGRWGALEFLDQPRAEAPKYDALLAFMEENPVWW